VGEKGLLVVEAGICRCIGGRRGGSEKSRSVLVGYFTGQSCDAIRDVSPTRESQNLGVRDPKIP